MNVNKNFTHIFRLDELEKLQLKVFINCLENIGFEHQNFTEKMMVDINYYSRQIPARLMRFLLEFKNRPNDEGAIIIQNLPIDEKLPNTPTDKDFSGKATFNSEWLLLLMMSTIADVIAYKEELQGKYIHDIVPRQGNEKLQINSGSVLLEFHTEHGFHPYKQDYIALICLRQDHNKTAATLGSSVNHALKRLKDKTIRILQQERYRIHLPDSFLVVQGAKHFSPNMAVLSPNLKIPNMCVDFDAMRAIDDEAQEALKAFEIALKETMVGNVLSPGEMLIIDNQLVAHARAPFTPRYDGQDRWLQRVSGVRDIRRVRNSCLEDTHICRSVIEEPLWKEVMNKEASCHVA